MSQNYGAKIVRDGLVLCLDAANPKSYPGTGTTWLDLSGNNNTATLGTDASYNSANRGTMLLSSSNTAGEITFSRDNFIFGSGDFTINLWANPTAIESFDTLYEMGYYTDGILFRPTGGSLDVYMGYSLTGGGNRSYTHTRTIGLWHYYTLTRSSGIVKVYINAVQNGTDWTNTASLTLNSTTICRIGSSSHTGSQRWNGYVNNFQIYNRTLSSNEIKNIFNTYRGRYGI